MKWFIKTELMTQETLRLPTEERKGYLMQHKAWVESISSSGRDISSGYLVDNKLRPGGGGVLLLKAKSFEEAKEIIEQDPMIKSGLVEWKLHEWLHVSGKTIQFFSVD